MTDHPTTPRAALLAFAQDPWGITSDAHAHGLIQADTVIRRSLHRHRPAWSRTCVMLAPAGRGFVEIGRTVRYCRCGKVIQ